MAIRRNEFQEIVYAIFVFVVFGMIGSIMFKDIFAGSDLGSIIRITIITSFVVILYIIFKKILDLLN